MVGRDDAYSAGVLLSSSNPKICPDCSNESLTRMKGDISFRVKILSKIGAMLALICLLFLLV
jgi:hypothetical protein